MALNAKQKKLFLIALLAVFTTVVLMQLGNIKDIFNLNSRSASGGDAAAPTSYSELQILEEEEYFPEIRMDLLDEASDALSGAERNPFDFGTDLDRAKQMELAEERAEQARKMLEEQQKVQEEPAAPPPPEIEMLFAGYVSMGEEARAVFLDDKDLIIGKEGDVINESLVIKKISYESIIMGYVDYEEQTREIPMKGS